MELALALAQRQVDAQNHAKNHIVSVAYSEANNKTLFTWRNDDNINGPIQVMVHQELALLAELALVSAQQMSGERMTI